MVFPLIDTAVFYCRCASLLKWSAATIQRCVPPPPAAAAAASSAREVPARAIRRRPCRRRLSNRPRRSPFRLVRGIGLMSKKKQTGWKLERFFRSTTAATAAAAARERRLDGIRRPAGVVRRRRGRRRRNERRRRAKRRLARNRRGRRRRRRRRRSHRRRFDAPRRESVRNGCVCESFWSVHKKISRQLDIVGRKRSVDRRGRGGTERLPAGGCGRTGAGVGCDADGSGAASDLQRQSGGHRADAAVRPRAADAQRADAPPARQERRQQEDALGECLSRRCCRSEVGTCLGWIGAQDAFSLLAYADPWLSPVGDQLDAVQREPVCAALNSAIMESHHLPRRPPMELAIAHARELLRLMAQNGLGSCAFANIDQLLQP